MSNEKILDANGLTEEEFIQYLGKNQVSIFHFDNREEFLEELNNA